MNFKNAAIKILKLSDFWAARVFQVAVKLNIFSLIHFGFRTAEEIAKKTKSNRRAIELFLNALVGLRLLKKKNKEFKNSPISEKYLVLGNKDYFGYGVKLDAILFETFAKLEEALHTGKPVRRADMFQSNPEELLVFIMAMHNYSSLNAPYLARHLSARGARSFLDVGCGPGTYACHFLKRNRRLKATLFDLPGTLTITQGVVKKFGMQKRVKLAAGDYRENPLPGKHELVFLSNICHGESAHTNQLLFQKIHAVLKPHGKLWIQDMVLAENGAHPGYAALFSLVMLLNTAEGRNYRWSEFKEWLEKAGFSKVRRLKLRPPNGSNIIEAVK